MEQVLREIDGEEQKKVSMRLGKWRFANKREQTRDGVVFPAVLPLQAADFLAYETYKQMANRIVDGVKRNVRKSLWDLLRVSHESNYYFDKDNLAKLVAIIDAEKKPK